MFKFIFTKENFWAYENEYKLPQSTIEVCEIIEEIRSDNEIKAAVHPSLSTYIRQYDASIGLVYGRYPSGSSATELYNLLNADVLNTDRITELIVNNQVDILVYYKNNEVDGDFLEKGFEYGGETSDYLILKYMEK